MGSRTHSQWIVVIAGRIGAVDEKWQGEGVRRVVVEMKSYLFQPNFKQCVTNTINSRPCFLIAL